MQQHRIGGLKYLGSRHVDASFVANIIEARWRSEYSSEILKQIESDLEGQDNYGVIIEQINDKELLKELSFSENFKFTQ